METQKRCIFHIPNYIDVNRKSASNIRPLKMIEAFKQNGYIVDTVMGYAKDRKKQIKKIKSNIKEGIKYDFMYSESSTMPTLLTEKHHLPVHPLLDFSFFRFCKKDGIRIGLFYRDIHWKFDMYKKDVSLLKRMLSILCYKYDVIKYTQLVDILYLSSYYVKKYLPKKIVNCKNNKIDILPPGCDIKSTNKNVRKDRNVLKIFYVGGISKDIYNFEKLFMAMSQIDGVELTVCCREKEWDNMKGEYNKYLNDKINIIHVGGEELQKYYNETDVCSLIFAKHEYMKMAMPVKLFEYLSNSKPIIVTQETVASEFIEKNGVGWVIPYEEEAILKLLKELRDNKNLIDEKILNIDNVIKDNTWHMRAKKVIKDLI